MPTVQDILEHKGREVASVAADCSVLDAAREMNRRHIGSVIVARDSGLVGIFTERDILVRVVAEGRDPANVVVGEVMTTPVVCCGVDTDLDECKALVTSRRIRHIPVVQGAEVVGIITSGDIMARESFDRETTIESLFEYINGPAAHSTTPL